MAFSGRGFAPNVLLALPPSDVEELMALPHGTKRINGFFGTFSGTVTAA